MPPQPNRYRRWRRLLLASIVALAAVPAVVLVSRATWPAGERPSAAVLLPAAAPSPPGPGPADLPPSPPVVASRSARLADQPPPQPDVRPSALRAGAVGIAAPVDAVGVEAGSTAMEVPDDAARVGWYRWGPVPGQAEGVTVMTAHVDSRRTGPGAFFRLRDLAVGERIEIDLVDGRSLMYEVIGREQAGKDELPVHELFRRDGAPALALVTCGGTFDTQKQHYTDNVIVWAVEV